MMLSGLDVLDAVPAVIGYCNKRTRTLI